MNERTKGRLKNKSGKDRGKTAERPGKDRGIADTVRSTTYSPVKIWYDGIISANFQEGEGKLVLIL